MSKASRRYLDSVADLGCIVCRTAGDLDVPATIHHVGNQTMGKRAPDSEAIPLCGLHHQHGGYGVAVHAGREEWERRHGTERDLLAQVREILA